MPPQTHQPLTEYTLLTRYLLLSSSLPTIIPFNTFLSLLPTSARNNEDLGPHVRRLYADLQTQRNIDLETVRNNIARECARAGTVKAQLRRDLARELDGSSTDSDNPNNNDAYIIDFKRDFSVELTPSRKRKRKRTADDDFDADRDSEASDPSTSTSNSSSEDNPNEEASQQEIPESHNADSTSSHSSSIIHVTSPTAAPPSEPPASPTTAQTAHLDLLLDAAFHGPRGLALPSTTTSIAHIPAAQPHTKASLLAAMEAAVGALEREIAGLEGEAQDVMRAMKETVGGLSDLRYGSFVGRGSGGGAGEERLEREVQTGLTTLREVVGRKVREL